MLNMSDMGELDADGLLVPLKSPALLYTSQSLSGAESAHLQKDMHFGGRLWRLRFEHDTPLLSPLERNLPALMAGAGVLYSAALHSCGPPESSRRAQALSHGRRCQCRVARERGALSHVVRPSGSRHHSGAKCDRTD